MKGTVTFNEVDGVEFEIEFIPMREKKEMLLAAMAKRKSWKKNDSDLDLNEFTRAQIMRSVVGWTGLKNKHLSQILSAERKADGLWGFQGELSAAGKYSANHEIEYSEDFKKTIAENCSIRFGNFVSYAQDYLDDQQQKQIDDELKN